MIAIGNFTFPKHTTLVQTNTIEAKSKVRKEIYVQSVLRKENIAELKRTLDELQKSVESFDRQQVPLSINTGRYYLGRRRSMQITPAASEPLAWIEFQVLTNDRYERSLILHRHEQNLYFGQAVFSLFGLGNWNAPLMLTLESSETLSGVQVSTANETFAITGPIDMSQPLTIDAENRQVISGETNLYAAANESFPAIVPGPNQVTVKVEPASAEVTCTVQYRDYWV